MNPELPQDAGQYLLLGVIHDPTLRNRLQADLNRFSGGELKVEVCGDAADAIARLQAQDPATERTAVLIADHDLPGGSGGDLLAVVQQIRTQRNTRKVLLTTSVRMEELDRPLQLGALNARLDKPWSYEQLSQTLRLLVTEYFAHHAPDLLEQIPDLIDVEILSELYSSSERTQRTVSGQLRNLQRSFFADRLLPDDQVESAMLEELDRVLHHPPRETLPRDAILLRRGEPVDDIYILIAGRVRLFREVNGREITFHAKTVGRIIGLMAMTENRPSFFDCRADTEITVIRLSLDALDEALQQSPVLAVHLVTVLLRGLNRRNRRAVSLQLEINALNEALAAERDTLRRTLAQLQAAQSQLIESERMVALGRLVAGIAHELNNPVAAITRNADFLRRDIESLAANRDASDPFNAMLHAALRHPPLPTREERRVRRDLAAALADEPLARRLVRIGITSPQEFHTHFAHIPTPEQPAHLERMESFYRIGAALKNVSACSERIVALVQSLRSYARGSDEVVVEADPHTGLDETLLIFGHALRQVEVRRHYGEVGVIACRPGRLNQVWTNLIANAVEAMHGQGTLTIQTDAPDPHHVRIRIIDNGPGIPPESVDQIFDLNFTSKQGRVDFGLGLGLSISQDIVHQHGGLIEVESRPGFTCFSITLPRHPETL
jgi:signal transduction histidine kinase